MTSSLEIPTIDLTGEVSIPQFGLGVFQVPPEDTAENVLQAIEMGYRARHRSGKPRSRRSEA